MALASIHVDHLQHLFRCNCHTCNNTFMTLFIRFITTRRTLFPRSCHQLELSDRGSSAQVYTPVVPVISTFMLLSLSRDSPAVGGRMPIARNHPKIRRKHSHRSRIENQIEHSLWPTCCLGNILIICGQNLRANYERPTATLYNYVELKPACLNESVK